MHKQFCIVLLCVLTASACSFRPDYPGEFPQAWGEYDAKSPYNMPGWKDGTHRGTYPTKPFWRKYLDWPIGTQERRGYTPTNFVEE